MRPAEMTEFDDAVLLSRSRSGDVAAFGDLVRTRHHTERARLDDEVPNVPRILRHRRARRTRRAPLARGVTFLPETAVRALF